MIPADRDAARRRAQAIVDGAPCTDVEEVFARYVLRYVPPADAEPPHPWRVRHDGCGMVAITLDALVVAMEPDAAHRLAHALHAAADAAEEMTR